MKRHRVIPPLLALALLPTWALPGFAADRIEIEHDHLNTVTSGVRADLESRISDSDGVGIRDARAYFKTEPASRYYFVPLDPGGDDGFRGVLPAMAAGTESFDYFILARSADDEIVKSDTWNVTIQDDAEALARMEQKPPREVKIDVDALEEAKDLVDESRKVTDADRSNVATRGGEPNPDERVEVRSDTPDAPQQIAGVDDYINLRLVKPAEAIGPSAISSAATTGGTGIGGGVLGGIAAVGAGVAVAGGGGGGGSSGGGGGSSAAAACNSQQVAGRDAPEVRTIELGRTSGSFVFQFETFTQQDRMAVLYEGSPLFDTGCVGASGARTLTYSGSSSRVRVAVQPNCAGGSGTSWNFTVNCP